MDSQYVWPGGTRPPKETDARDLSREHLARELAISER